MFLDSQTNFSAAQPITAIGDTPSTNVLDTGTSYDEGAGDAQYLFVKTVAAATSGGAATLQVILQDSADNSAWGDVMACTPALALAALTANRVLVRQPLPLGLRRYWRVVYRVGTAVLTGGSVSAYLADAVPAQQTMPTGFAVL